MSLVRVLGIVDRAGLALAFAGIGAIAAVNYTTRTIDPSLDSSALSAYYDGSQKVTEYAGEAMGVGLLIAIPASLVSRRISSSNRSL